MKTLALLLSIGLAAVTASAAEPPAPATAAPAAAPAASTAPAAAAQTVAASDTVSPETLKKAIKLGLRPRQRKGTTMYCKDYADVGTRIASEHCYAAAGLDSVIDQMTQAQEMMRRTGACGGTGQCGGN
jgi:hypothetical protein